MRNHPFRSNTRLSRPIHRGDASSGAWGLAALALFSASAALSGCVSDPDCGICDPENLILETVAGVNYAGKIVKVLDPECEGPNCPGEIKSGNYFVEKVIPCRETTDAIKAARGAEEWCKVSPLIVNEGLQFIFNNLLDPQSVELVRKSPANPQLFEVYDWKTRIVHLEGPVARYNGDYRPGTQTQPDQITRLVSLSCIDNLADQGKQFDHNTLNDGLCDGLFVEPTTKKTIPLKMRMGQEIKTYHGETDTRRMSESCTSPQDGVDSCCDACDFELAANVAKYGLTTALPETAAPSFDQLRNPNTGNAITCDLMGDKFAQCRDFIPHVNRSQEVRKFSYDWNGDGKVDPGTETFRVPMQDKLRETHPDDRPDGSEQKNVPCQIDEDCAAKPYPNLPGMNCVGTKGGQACTGSDPDCTNKVCVAEWFVECRAEPGTTGEQGYCVDKRWSGTPACFETQDPYPICLDEACSNTAMESKSKARGRRFAFADSDLNKSISALEGCRSALGGPEDGQACDPYLQPGVNPIGRYDRKDTLPSITRNCVCEETPAEGCEDIVTQLCREDGDRSKPLIKEKVGQYAVKFWTRRGGVVYDPAIKGVLFLPADLGGMPRSFAENCSQARSKGAGALNIKDGWRGNDNGGFESFENFDRAMCSSSTYKIVFSEPKDGGAAQYIRDKVGNTLAGKSTYVIHTPDFHVVPGSGFPTNNLRIGACDEFELRFSNKYDMSPSNLEKLQIIELTGPEDNPVEGKVVAGGPNCAHTEEELNGSNVPCLAVNVRDQEIGSVRIEIDSKEFGALLEPSKGDKQIRYRFKVPGMQLKDGEDVFKAMAERPEEYKAAFWDACGMPLVLSMPKLDDSGVVSPDKGKAAKPDYWYDFEIDAPKCKEDIDLDGFPQSCDNAPNHFNPNQDNVDGDEFGDVFDRCPTVATMTNTADQDRDGIGNECDFCARPVATYNKNATAMVSPKMRVRNIPDQSDYDRDGIGDVCDNCITRPNCGEFGDGPNLTPAKIGDAIPYENASQCQVDNDSLPFLGDACAVKDQGMDIPIQEEGAAGPVGFGPTDDFDQDGIINDDDRCPRQRVAACVTNEDCGADDLTCLPTGFCSNHPDFDGDDVGDMCDTCPYVANPGQVQMGQAEEDDLDGDFVGSACETTPDCANTPDARPIAFYDKIAPSGMCCTTVFPVDTLDAPRLMPDNEPMPIEEVQRLMEEFKAAREEWAMAMDGSDPPPSPLFVPLKADCGGLGPDKCRQLEPKVLNTDGIVNLPRGCAEAGQKLTLDSPGIDGDATKLYQFACTLPQRDQDFDGLGDECDMCPFTYDPKNTLYKDANNKVWPSSGQYCQGVWAPDAAPRLLSQCGDLSEDSGMSGTDTMMSTDTTTDGTTTGG